MLLQLIDATSNGEDMRKRWLTEEVEQKLKKLKPKFLMDFQVACQAQCHS